MDQLLALVPTQDAIYVSATIGIAAVVAMFLPAPTDKSSKLYVFGYKVVNALAANKFHATNASAPK